MSKISKNIEYMDMMLEDVCLKMDRQERKMC